MALFEFKSHEIFGTEISQGKIVVNSAAKKANVVKKSLFQALKKRKIPNFSVEQFPKSSQEWIVSKKVITKGEEVTIAIEIKSWGDDMLITLKHYEKSAKNTTKRIITGIVMGILGAGFFWLGVPFILVVVGFIWAVFLKSRLSVEDQDESNLLKNLVTDTLGKVLKTNKLKASDISLS